MLNLVIVCLAEGMRPNVYMYECMLWDDENQHIWPENTQSSLHVSQRRTFVLIEMDGWMTCDISSFLTVFQSYQDDGRMIMKGYVRWNPVYDWKDPRLRQGSNSGPINEQVSA